MVHARKSIRDAFKARLTGLVTTEDRVHLRRTHPVDESDMPALLIYFSRETSEADSQDRPIALRRLPLIVVEGVAQNSDVEILEDTLDQIAAEVETAIGGDATLGGVVDDVMLEQTDADVDGTGNKPTGRIGLGFRVEYRTAEDNPEIII